MSKHNSSLLGRLLVANPNNPRDGLERSVIVVIAHTPGGTSQGLRINSPQQNLRFATIFHQLGLPWSGDDVVYHSGNVNTDKIHVIHTLDWQGLTTVEIAPGLGLTQDISIMTAMSKNQGPEQFRACAGLLTWVNGGLEQQLDPKEQTLHCWETVTADLNLVFDFDSVAQWHTCIEATAREQAQRWFNLFQG